MAHEITEKDSGAFAFRPWHGLGTQIPKAATADEILEIAELDWKVIGEVPIYTKEGSKFTQVQEFVANVRDSDRQVLGITTPSFENIQNRTMAEIIVAIQETGIDGHEVLFESAFSTHSGKQVAFLARVDEDIIIGNSQHQKYILGLTRHDGTAAARILPTDVRVQCANTISWALQASDVQVRLTHRGDSTTMDQKIVEAKRIMGVVSKSYDEFYEVYRDLAAVPGEPQLQPLFTKMFGVEETRSTLSKVSIATSAPRKTRHSMC